MDISGRFDGSRRYSSELVGRDAELSALRENLASRTSIVSGPAGIGKTRLAEEIAGEALADGWLVLWAGCASLSGRRAYWPWVHVFGSLLSDPETADLAAMLAPDRDTLERIELFDVAVTTLRDHGDDAPILIVLDDLHRADTQSLLLFRFLIEQLHDSQVRFIGTTRPSDSARIDQAGQHGALLDACHVIELAGLPVAAVELLVGDAVLAEAMWAASAGNPMLIDQLNRSSAPLHSTQGLTAGSHALLSLVRTRIRELPVQTRNALVAISMFDAPPTRIELAELLDIPPPAVSARLDPAVDAGMVQYPGPLPSRFEFSHQIFAEALSTEVPQAIRDGFHARRARSLHGKPVAFARHLLMIDATSEADLVNAVLAAVDHCAAEFAFEDAIALCLDALERLPGAGTPQAHVGLLAALGRAYWRSGDHHKTAQAYDDAWQWALKSTDPNLAGAVALGPEFRFEFSGPGMMERVRRCEWVLERLPQTPSLLRVQLLATLAAAQFAIAPETAGATATTAIELAATLKCPLATLYALVARGLTDVLPENIEERIRSARLVLAGAHGDGTRELADVGYFLLLSALLEKGDIVTLDAELTWRSQGLEHFPELHQGRTRRWFGCLRTILDGDSAAAEKLADDLLRLGTKQGDPDALSIWIAHRAIISWMRGSIADAESLFLQARQHEPGEALWTASLGWLWLAQGRESAARAMLATLPALDAIPKNRNWAATLVLLADIAIRDADTDAIILLREALLPYAEHVAPIGVGVAFWGTPSRALGLLCEQLGLLTEAREHLEGAVAMCLRIGAHAWLAEAQIELAGLLIRHGEKSGAAYTLLREAVATAAGLGLRGLHARANAMLAELAPTAGATLPGPATTPPATARAQIAVMGKFEVFSEAGERARWTSRKARELLKILVSRRGIATSREVIMDELWPDQDRTKLANRFAVALNTVRRAIDPGRAHDLHHFVDVEGESIRLRIDRVQVDVEAFLAQAQGTSLEAMRTAVAAYGGDVFSDEPYADWAAPLRTEVNTVLCDLALRLAEFERTAGHPVAACELFRKVTDIDPYNESAYVGLAATLTAMGAHGQALTVRERLTARLAELGV